VFVGPDADLGDDRFALCAQRRGTILDIYSCKVLSRRVSNMMTPDFCLKAIQEALQRHGKPEIFNTD
jgi:transposase InsO family protein